MKTPVAIFLTILATAPPAFAQSATNPWSEPPGVPAQMGSGGGVVAVRGAANVDSLYILCGDNNGSNTAATNLFFKYTISTETWTELPLVPASVGVGGAITWMPGTNSIYVLRGEGKREFYRFDISAGLWDTTALAPLPQVPGSGAALTATPASHPSGGKVYALRGDETTSFYSYSPDTDSWATNLAGTASPVVGGSSLAHAGAASDSIYAVGTAKDTGTAVRLWRYSIAGNSWTFTLPVLINLAGGLAADPVNPDILYARYEGNFIGRFDALANNGLGAWGWPGTQGDPTLPYDPNGGGTVSAGAGLAFPQGDDRLHVVRGGTNHVWRVDVSDRKLVTSHPLSPGSAFLVSVNDGERLYSMSMLGDSEFYRYTVSDKTWTAMAPLPISKSSHQQVRPTNRTKMAFDGQGYVYVIGIDLYPNMSFPSGFLRYSVDGDTWEELKETFVGYLAATNSGTGIVASNGVLFAALQGTTYGNLWSYANGAWQKKAPPPAAFYQGCAMAYPGSGDRIYVLRGGQGFDEMGRVIPSPEFWCYSISLDAWNIREDGSPFDPADAPSNAGFGASLCYSGRGAMLYGFTGYLRDEPRSPGRFLGYSTTGDRWIEGTRAPASASGGSALASPGPGRHLYAITGLTELWRYEKENFVPNPPSSLAQFHENGTPIDARGITVASTISVRARLDDDDSEEGSDRVWMEVELKRAAVAFDGTGLVGSEHVITGSTVSVSLTLPDIDAYYHWRARAVDSRGGKGAWGAAWNILYRSNAAPVVTVTATQLRAWNGVPIEPGEKVLDEGGITFQVSATDSHNDPVAIEVRLARVGDTSAAMSPHRGPMTPGGTAALTERPAPGEYHWECRVLDEWDAATAWTSFRGSSNQEVDFVLLPFGSQGGAGCIGGSTAAWRMGFLAPLLALLAASRRMILPG